MYLEFMLKKEEKEVKLGNRHACWTNCNASDSFFLWLDPFWVSMQISDWNPCLWYIRCNIYFFLVMEKIQNFDHRKFSMDATLIHDK